MSSTIFATSWVRVHCTISLDTSSEHSKIVMMPTGSTIEIYHPEFESASIQREKLKTGEEWLLHVNIVKNTLAGVGVWHGVFEPIGNLIKVRRYLVAIVIDRFVMITVSHSH